MLIKTQEKGLHIPSSEITSHSSYLNRRQLIKGLGQGLGLGAAALAMPSVLADSDPVFKARALKYQKASSSEASKGFYTDESLTPFEDVTTYNNFYEFGTSKSDPSEYAPRYLKTSPWSISVTGQVKRKGEFHLEGILKRFPLEERIYRLRCVEAWSMVIPWVGFTLADLIRFLEPESSAKYVAFETLADSKQMPGLRSVSSFIDWPYREGLRIDEAMNELTLMAVGVYGKEIFPQNGAPIRLVVPWKYGFKSIKSIVGIHFTDKQPVTSWNKAAPREYGFYSNVNPHVDHPRWSQASERRLPSGLFDFSRKETLMFNGYQEQVAHLYKGMDLKRNY